MSEITKRSDFAGKGSEVLRLRIAASPNSWMRSERVELPASPGFLSVLKESGGTMLVASRQGSKVLAIRSDGKTCFAETLPVPSPMGLAARPGYLAIGFGNGVAVLGKVSTAQHGPIFFPAKTHICGAIGIHDLSWDGPDLRFLSSTFSAICSLSHTEQFRIEWRPDFCGLVKPDDCCHANGMALGQEGNGYVTALGGCAGFESWRAEAPLGGILMDLRGKIYLRNLGLPHSPIFVGSEVWFAESAYGRVRALDPQRGSAPVVFETKHFVRGLAAVGPRVFCGLSRVRETAKQWVADAPRMLADLPMAQVVVIDAARRDTLGWVDLPGVDEISSLLYVPEAISFASAWGDSKRRTLIFAA